MQEIITSREMVEMAVINLLNGTQTIKISKADNSSKNRYHTILSQYLRQSYHHKVIKRERLTKKIIDALKNAVQTSMQSSNRSDDNIGLKMLLFLYVVSGVDFSYLYWIDTAATATELTNAVFDAFMGKESLSKKELYNLVYEKIYGKEWRIDRTTVQIAYIDYLNYYLGHTSYYTAESQLQGMPTEEVFLCFGNIYDFESDMTVEKYQEELSTSAQTALQKITEGVQLLIDLIKADTWEKFLKQYGDKFDEKDFSNQNRTMWKIYVLQKKRALFHFASELRTIFSELTFSKQYHYYYAKISESYHQLLQINELCKKIRGKHSAANQKLTEDTIFKNALRSLRSCKDYLQIQVRIDTELCTFGNDKSLSTMRTVTNARSYIRAFLDFLFYGISSKAGKKEYDTKCMTWKIKEYRNTHLSKYLSEEPGNQKNFTITLKNSLYYRILYYLFPEKQLNNPSSKALPPDKFMIQLWQFYYYALGIDFYMLRRDEHPLSKTFWCEIIEEQLDALVKGEDIPTLRFLAEKRYTRYQLHLEEATPTRFIPKEIHTFRTQDIMSYIAYERHYSKFAEEVYDQETSEAVQQYICTQTELKLSILLEKSKSTIELLRELVNECDERNFTPPSTMSLMLYNTEYRENWKYKNYTRLCDSTGKQYIISQAELAELMEAISVAVNVNIRASEKMSNIQKWKEILWKQIDVLSKIEQEAHPSLPNIYKIDQPTSPPDSLNCELIDSMPVQYLYTTLRTAYKYLIYREWVDNNLSLSS